MLKPGDIVKLKTCPSLTWKVIKLVEVGINNSLWVKVCPIDPIINKPTSIVLTNLDDSIVDYRPWLSSKGFCPSRSDGLEGNINQFCQENGGSQAFNWWQAITVPPASCEAVGK